MKILFCFVFLICCVGMVPGQERMIDKAEFDRIMAEGNSHKIKWEGEKYRMTVTTSSKAIGRPQTDYSSKMIIEFGPSMESRSVNTSVFGSNPAKRWEAMRIGDWQYTRSGNDPWTRKAYAASAPSRESEETPYQILSSKAEYKYVGQATVSNKPVQVFVKAEHQTKVNQKTGENVESESKSTYWVDANGMILKSESSYENRGKITSQTSVIMEWQLDPSITFTAPVIAP